jgi:hypothetical protein
MMPDTERVERKTFVRAATECGFCAVEQVRPHLGRNRPVYFDPGGLLDLSSDINAIPPAFNLSGEGTCWFTSPDSAAPTKKIGNNRQQTTSRMVNIVSVCRWPAIYTIARNNPNASTTKELIGSLDVRRRVPLTGRHFRSKEALLLGGVAFCPN